MAIDRLIDLLIINDVEYTKVRVGNKHDGGYVLLKELMEKIDTVYSFGIGDDVGFELDLINKFPNIRNIEMFDPTIDNLPIRHEKFNWSKDKELSIIDNNSLLKMDIEHSEWQCISMLRVEDLLQFNQIVVEFHIIFAEVPKNLSPYFTTVFKKALCKINENVFVCYSEVIEKLNKYFYIFHIHANNSLPIQIVDGYIIPPLLEVSFVRKDLVKVMGTSKHLYPIEDLDSPNKTDRADIINFYPFKEV